MSHCATVAENVVLDGRLALFHEQAHWLAVADLHFGYELSQRVAGNLFPWWGMQTIEERLMDLLGAYKPADLVLLGDLVHNEAGAFELTALVERLRRFCRVHLIAGNHDRHLHGAGLIESWQSGEFYFHHGHGQWPERSAIQVMGHHHPAAVMRDGAGLRLKLPAFVQENARWVMPAFSPWAAGTKWPRSEQSRIWLCSPQRVFPF
jgi:uncharacterized protein